MIKPWPQSPNMTAKRNGNVMMVNRAVCRKKVKKKTKSICKIEWKATYIDILKVLYIKFFLVGYAILKDFSYLFGTKFTSQNSTRDIMTILLINSTVSDISRHSRHRVCQSFFWPRAFIIWFKSNQVKQADLETWSLAPSLRDLVHWSLLRSLLRTYDRSTYSKSTTYSVN